ncbi:LysR family transcriptional regulator [Azospirillum canadense]|uniref:LysR family transcriptional regulator n=1 Tax=Azospirillum canadense TaxID=403962 RepID=UPI00222628A4|nr:LysR family transcriptional regulator [Azospirillum canadense]MCW2240482.1 DNA-binding transcriptional LysR family regulator [Azospirillum canadense]
MLPINERHLRYFMEIVASGSVRGAAERLNIEPSVVSRQLRQLEDNLGCALFTRSGRRLSPTDAAYLVLDHCHERRVSEDALRARLADIGGALLGRIHIATGEGYIDDLMRWVLGDFRARHVKLEVTLEQVGAREAVRLVSQDQAHIGVAYCATVDPTIRIVRSYQQPVCLIAPPDHPLATSGQPPSLAEIAAFPIALMTSGFGLREIVHQAEIAAGVVLRPALTTNSLATARNFVTASLGVTFTSARLVASDIDAGRCRAIQTTSEVLNSAEVQLLVRTGRHLPRAVTSLLEFLESRATAWGM